MQIETCQKQRAAQVEANRELAGELERAKKQQMLCEEEVDRLRAEKQELGKEMEDSEQVAFKDFCKKAKIKSVKEFEASLSGNTTDHALLERRNELEHTISKQMAEEQLAKA